MSLTRALSNAYSGLATAGRRADIAANNIANANTPGYVRRSALLVERSVGAFGNGVAIDGITREQNVAVTNQRRDADASLARADVIAGAYEALTNALGEPDDGYGIFSALGNLETQLRELAVSPDSAALYNGVLSAASEITGQFNALSQTGSDLRTNADAAIAVNVETVNQNLHRLFDLNNEITAMQAMSENFAVLEDERQRLFDEINQIIPIRTQINEGGWADIMTESGVYMLSSTVHEVEFQPSGLITPALSYDDGAGALSGLQIGDQDITPGTDGLYPLSGGTLTGLFAIRDDIGESFIGQIDALAFEIADRFASPDIDPTLLLGEAGLFTDDGGALDPANIAGLAQRLSLNPAIDPAQGGTQTRLRDGINSAGPSNAGDSEIINNLVTALTESRAAPASTGFTGQFSMTEVTAELMSDMGAKRVRHDAIALTAYSRADILYQAEVSASGVDTDEEMQSLLLIEQAYAANARVIETVNQMLDRLMQL